MAVAAVVGGQPLAAVAAPPPARLPLEVSIALDRAKLPRESLAVVVQEVGAPRPVLSWQAETPMNPASLTKVLTTAAALDLLGPAWTWNTPVWLQGPLRQGVLEGDLVIKGSGDPKLVTERIWLLLRRVQQWGVREIRGDIVLDRSAFTLTEQAPGAFDGEASRPYNVQPDALLLNFRSVTLTFSADVARNAAVVSATPSLAGVAHEFQVTLGAGPCDDWRAGLKADFSDPTRLRVSGAYPAACGERAWPVAYADPASYNARLLSALWREMGGTLGGRVRDGTAPATPPSFVISSPPLAEVVRDINKFSNNPMAQQLFLTLALERRGQATAEAARDVMRQWLDQRHPAPAAGAVIDNGSGLSRETRVSARLLADVLQATWASGTMPELMSSLPITGVDGTLRRARNTPLGRAHLKTGSLRDVAGIAGYVLAHDGRRYAVVALINHPQAMAGRPALEAVAQWTALEASHVEPNKE